MPEASGEHEPDGFDLMSKETLALIARDLLAKVKEMKAENERLHGLTEGDTTSIYAEAADWQRKHALVTEREQFYRAKYDECLAAHPGSTEQVQP